jgi:small multidrug resistance family-3 protein
LRSIALYAVAAALEIFGCFTFWLWLRMGRSPLWVLPGTLSLVLFSLALSQIESTFAGRAFAAYGGVYIVASLAWLWIVERKAPEWTDVVGSAICLIGAGVILFGSRSAGA